MQKNTEQTYQELREQYTDEEIVDSVLFNEELSAKEQRTVDKEFRKLRLEHLKSLTAKDRLIGDIIQMKVLIKKYFRQDRYNEQYSFANQLKAYIKLTNRSNKEIAANLDIHPTKLSRIVNGRDTPNIELMYRLEKHSDGELPAHYWWRLHSKELEFQIKTNLEQKLKEGEKVSDYLDIKG
jgi:plasmid maintenance system antidote protein VapI